MGTSLHKFYVQIWEQVYLYIQKYGDKFTYILYIKLYIYIYIYIKYGDNLHKFIYKNGDKFT